MPGQLARLMRHIDNVQRIVVVISAGFGDMLVCWPDIQRALDGSRAAMTGPVVSGVWRALQLGGYARSGILLGCASISR
jgi:hypothetical protein